LTETQLEALVCEHQGGLLRYAARFLGDATAAQDVVQEVFIRLCRNWEPAACPEGRLRFWLYRLTHNVAVDYARRQNRLRRLHQDHADVTAANRADPGHDPETRTRLVLEQLPRLEPPERQVLLLRLQDGFSYKEISEITGRTEGNVGCLLHHAVRKMAALLKARQEGAP
jgi:RNA polymerase sigma-70 factor (ECF subfamily)